MTNDERILVSFRGFWVRVPRGLPKPQVRGRFQRACCHRSDSRHDTVRDATVPRIGLTAKANGRKRRDRRAAERGPSERACTPALTHPEASTRSHRVIPAGPDAEKLAEADPESNVVKFDKRDADEHRRPLIGSVKIASHNAGTRRGSGSMAK